MAPCSHVDEVGGLSAGDVPLMSALFRAPDDFLDAGLEISNRRFLNSLIHSQLLLAVLTLIIHFIDSSVTVCLLS